MNCFGLIIPVLPQLVANAQQFDLILADPPYGEKNVGRRSTSLAQQLIDDSELPKLLAPGGRFVIELGVPDLRRFPPGAAAQPFDRDGRSMGANR